MMGDESGMGLLLVPRLREVLDLWHLAGSVSAEHLAGLVANGVSFYEQPILEGPPLMLFRLFSPASSREEVFLGSVLLHDYLSKALVRVIEAHGTWEKAGRIALIAQDLESAYYVYQGRSTFAEIARGFQREALDSLADLYFGDEDPARGIHGQLMRMFTFTKSDFEPFPVYALPAFLARELEQAVRTQLEWLLSEADFARYRRTIGATFSFFYGWPSDGRGTSDTQSFAVFLLHLATDYQLVSASQLAHALGLGGEAMTKEAIKKALDTDQYIVAELRALLKEALARIQGEIDQGNERWLLGFIRKDRKLIALPPQSFVEALVAGVQLGPFIFTASNAPTPASPQDRRQQNASMHCRLCMKATAMVREQHITFGVNAFRFHNFSAKASGKAPTLCVRCAVSSYLQQRVLGSKQKRAKNPGETRPQIPQRYMMIFHYGHHSDRDAQMLAAKIDAILTLLASFKQRRDDEKSFFSLEDIREELARRVQDRTTLRLENEEMLLDLFADERLIPSLDMCFSMATGVQAQVIALGTGANRLLVLILPQIESEYKEAAEFVQRRFSESRLAIFTFLALLQMLCGCHGPYYFESVPRLGAASNFRADGFYVHGKAEPSGPLLTRYSAVVNFARRIAKYRKGHSLLADWILLAERIEANPFGMLSEVIRRSPLRAEDRRPEKRDKFDYLPLVRKQPIGPAGMVDAKPYLAFAEQFKSVFRGNQYTLGQRKEQEEMKTPPLDPNLLDEFFTILCRALDRMGKDLLPFYGREKSNAYEKYPRMLIDAVRRYDNVEIGFKEWASKILRDANSYQRDEAFPSLLAVEHWLIAHRELLEGQTKALNQLSGSLLFQTYQYLAPRRQLVMAYAEAKRGNADALKEEAIRESFPIVLAGEIKSLAEVYGGGEYLDGIVADAQEFLITYSPLLQWKL
jgi:hypothetical protein